MASPSAIAAAFPPEPPPASGFVRRLTAEWALLRQLAALNEGRLTDLSGDDTILRLTLHATPALVRPTVDAAQVPNLLKIEDAEVLTEHRLELRYPRYFPSVPLELYLERPVLHPNVHPVTGFVCLWDSHRVEHSVEHALHKTVAILGWRLVNREARHIMQPEAVALTLSDGGAVADRLLTPALRGISHEPLIQAARPLRERLL